MTFLDMVNDLKADISRTRTQRSGALAQLAGMVKGVVDAWSGEADAAVNEVAKARVRVYKPRKARAAKKDPMMEAAEAIAAQQEKDAAEKAAIVAKLSKLESYNTADAATKKEMEAAAKAADPVAARRAAKEAAKAEQEEALKARKERTRSEFKGRFAQPEVIGKTERFEAYIEELKDAVEQEAARYKAAGLKQGNTELVKELERSMRTGAIKQLDEQKHQQRWAKEKEVFSGIKGAVNKLDAGITQQLLGPFAGMYTTIKDYTVEKVKNFVSEKRDSIKKWAQENLNQKKLLAEIAHLRSEGKEVPRMLRLQMMLSTVMNTIMSGLSALLSASPFIIGGAVLLGVAAKLGKVIGEAAGNWINDKLPTWLGGGGGEKERYEKRAAIIEKEGEERAERYATGKVTEDDKFQARLAERMEALLQKKYSKEGLSADDAAELEQYRSFMQEESQVSTGGKKWKVGRAALKVGKFFTGGAYSPLAPLADQMVSGPGKSEVERLLAQASSNLNQSAAALQGAAAAGQAGRVNMSVQSVSGGGSGGGQQVHSHIEQSEKHLWNGNDEIIME